MSHLRAPLRSGEVLLHPDQDWSTLVHCNEAGLRAGLLFGHPLAEVRAAARAELTQRADDWGAALGWAPAQTAPAPLWIVGGHQPELFHPGVWVKNAVLTGLARRLSGTALNLVVDSDLAGSSSISLPGRDELSTAAAIPWDIPRGTGPWEERAAPDEALFATFGQRCAEAVAPWGWAPLAGGLPWGGSPGLPVVDRLVQLRHQWEAGQGLHNRELKSSQWSETPSFRWFIWQLMGDSGAFRGAYNAALAEYRAVNHIRSRSHPVPPLEMSGDRVELPIWVWRAGESQRGRLFVTVAKGRLQLTDGDRFVGELPLPGWATTESALAGFDTLASAGWKLRPRALLTTLVMRLCVASVFVHGIGGAKYDELTDRIIATYFQRTPPQLIVATATLRLLERFAGEPLSSPIAELRHRLRQAHWNPEHQLQGVPAVADLVAEKGRLIHPTDCQDRSVRRSTHQRIQAINYALRLALAASVRQQSEQLAQRLTQRPRDQALRSREYSSILFPESTLAELFGTVRKRIGL